MPRPLTGSPGSCSRNLLRCADSRLISASSISAGGVSVGNFSRTRIGDLSGTPESVRAEATTSSHEPKAMGKESFSSSSTAGGSEETVRSSIMLNREMLFVSMSIAELRQRKAQVILKGELHAAHSLIRNAFSGFLRLPWCTKRDRHSA